MPEKKTFVLRLNPEVYNLLEKWAADEFRSVNGQLEWIIEKALKDAKRNPSGREKKNSG
ncbi:MAG: Arc family DNA-binding protein [Bacteroidetes bacterium]|nr:Arc family DNA-binding protein [Bacteroidota bacterium]